MGISASRTSSGCLPGAGPLTNGITSPARLTITRMPILTPRARTTSWLASVALETVVPPTNTGSRTALGTTLPPGPTSQRDVAQDRLALLRRELDGDRAARGVGAEAGGGERPRGVELDDHAVDVVVVGGAAGLDRLDDLEDGVGALDHLRPRGR